MGSGSPLCFLRPAQSATPGGITFARLKRQLCGWVPISGERAARLVFYAFDLLHLDGRAIRQTGLSSNKENILLFLISALSGALARPINFQAGGADVVGVTDMSPNGAREPS